MDFIEVDLGGKKLMTVQLVLQSYTLKQKMETFPNVLS